jgi:hypothetical protein
MFLEEDGDNRWNYFGSSTLSTTWITPFDW